MLAETLVAPPPQPTVIADNRIKDRSERAMVNFTGRSFLGEEKVR